MKKIVLAIAIALTAFAGLSADSKFGIGLDYALYSDTKITPEQFAGALKSGDGLFGGLFGEFRSDSIGVGLAYNFSVYQEDFSFYGSGDFKIDMIDSDLNVYLQFHPLEMDSVLDLFFELGAGYISKDYLLSFTDPDPENPVLASYYVDIGAGLGVNIGPFGLFIKGLYMINYASVEGKFTNTATDTVETYTVTDYPLKNLKIMIGGKLSF